MTLPRMRLAAGVFAVLALSMPTGVAAATQPMLQVPGNEAPGLGVADRLGDEDTAALMTVQLALKLRNAAELEKLATSVNDPKSASFGHYLTPAQFAARYAPTRPQVDTAVGFLNAAGLHVTSVSPDSILVNATGSVAAVNRAMATRVGRYRDRRTGSAFFANDATPRLPASVGAVVQGVHGLDNHYLFRRAPVTATPRVGAGPAGGYTPAQLRTAYALTAAPLSTYVGTGQSIGIFELDGYSQAHINAYDNLLVGTPPPTPVRVAIDGGAGTPGGGQVEVELDIEVAHAIAPAATVVVYEAPNTNAGANDAYDAMVNGGAKPNSTSWGLCEDLQGTTETNTLHGIFVHAAALGESFFSASGDSGAFDCYDPSTGVTGSVAVDSPSSDPFVTGVGGTTLTLNGNNTYASESAWGGPANRQPEGSGGGNSKVHHEPSWQAGVHQSQNVGVAPDFVAMRQVPDVSLDGDPQTGYAVYTVRSNGTVGWGVVAGTSAGAPAWAAFAAIYNQYACVSDTAGLGNANPQLYAAASNTTFTAYHDVTTGNSGNAATWSAATGWDYATGLGSLSATGMAGALQAGVSPGSAPPHINRIGTGPALASGAPLGGNVVTISGCGFRRDSSLNPPTVRFGGTASPQVTWLDSANLQAVVPAHNGALVDVSVLNPSGAGGAGDTTLAAYLYTAPTGGYAILTGAGAIYTFGDALYYGNLLDGGHAGQAGFPSYPGPAVGLAATPDGGGYNILNSGGGIYTFGNGHYYGNLIDGGHPGLTGFPAYPGPAVALSYTPTGGGYSILNAGGGIYSFGDALYYGNLIDGGHPGQTGFPQYPGPAVSLAWTPSGLGYSILTSSGAIYSFGDAQYFGNLLDHGYPGVAVSLNMTKSGSGYSILTSSGALYTFGDANYLGNLLDRGYPGPAVAISDTP